MYAIDTLSDSLAVTKRYLGSLGFGGWLKVALVVLLLGGIGFTSQLFNLPFNAVADATEESDALWVVLLVFGPESPSTSPSDISWRSSSSSDWE